MTTALILALWGIANAVPMSLFGLVFGWPGALAWLVYGLALMIYFGNKAKRQP